MKHLFYSGLIFLFLVFNCSAVVFASTDFDGDFSGSSTGNSYTYYTTYFCISSSYPTANLVRVQNSGINVMSNATVDGTVFNKRTLYLYRNSETGELVYLNSSYVGSSTWAWSTSPVYIPLVYNPTFSGYTLVDTVSTSQGSISGSFQGDIVIPQQNILEYPPAFPISTGLSYEVYNPSFQFNKMTISSKGVTIPDGYDFALCDVTYNIVPSSSFQIGSGSYALTFYPSGDGQGSGTYDPNLFLPSNYVTSARFVENGIFYNLTAFNFSYNFAHLYFDFFGDSRTVGPSRTLNFTVTFFVTKDISSFNYTLDYFNRASVLYVASDSVISDSLTSAGGANSGLNSQNDIMSGALSDYQRDTDTSAQYSNISDSLFVLDTSIFTQVASTITLFSSVVTGLFTAFGDFSVPLTLMLIVTFVSCIIGIIKITSDSS